MVVRAQQRGDVGVGPGQVAQVLADAEGAARTGQHHDPHAGVGGLAQAGGQLGVGRAGQGVQDLGPVQRQAQDGPVAVDQHVGHGWSLRLALS